MSVVDKMAMFLSVVKKMNFYCVFHDMEPWIVNEGKKSVSVPCHYPCKQWNGLLEWWNKNF